MAELVERGVDDEGERGEQQRPAEVGDLQHERQHVKARAVIEREEQRIDQLAGEHRGDGGEREVPAAIARAAPEPEREDERAARVEDEHAREERA